MTSSDVNRGLRGRVRECDELDKLLARAVSGRSDVLVLRGEPGVGKTALLDYVVERADDFAITRATGVEAEVELAFAALQQLCSPFLDGLSRLPEPQRQALGTAFGSRSGEVPDRFLVGLAVLGLLAESAERSALLCVIDDAQWIDTASAQTLTFVARRLAAERIAMVFAVRDVIDDPGTGEDSFAVLPLLTVRGLADADAAALFDGAIAGPLDDRVRSRIIAESRGNPLALLELPRDLDAAELAFGIGPADHAALTSRIERSFTRRLEALPAPTRELMLIAAAEPIGDVTLLWRAAKRLGIPVDAVIPAQEAGLIELGARVRFRHPLMRSAIYRAATEKDRRTAHKVLAEAMVGDVDSDRLAWHRAEAAAGLEEGPAAQLEISASRAQTRGGWAAAAAFLTRSVELTPDPRQRARRALAAANARLQAGAIEAAHAMLTIAEVGPLGDVDGARAQLLGAQISFISTRGREAPALLLAAAKRFEPLDAVVARETYLDAFTAALFAGRLAGEGGAIDDVAQAILSAHGSGAGMNVPPACELLLDGLATLVTDGYGVGVPMLRRALVAMRSERSDDEESLRWLWPASRAARAVGDDVSWLELTDRHVRLARKSGALAMLPIALTERFTVELFLGDLAAALSLAAEADAVTTATGAGLSPHIAFLREAWSGSEVEARALIGASRRDVSARGEGLFLAGTELTSAVFLNSFGRYEEALEVAENSVLHPFELGLSTWVYPELIEAAVRTGDPDRALSALARLSEIARASNTDWSLGVLARCRALLDGDAIAEASYQESIERLGRTSIAVALARTNLLYGEWLRRSGRRSDAREHLRAAHEFFRKAGMEGFAERTRRELAATGETVRARSVDTANELTPQELLIARLAADGRSNVEIGTQLFISPRTVEWHLGKVFTKLGVTSRKGLRASVAAAGPGLARSMAETGRLH